MEDIKTAMVLWLLSKNELNGYYRRIFRSLANLGYMGEKPYEEITLEDYHKAESLFEVVGDMISKNEELDKEEIMRRWRMSSD